MFKKSRVTVHGLPLAEYNAIPVPEEAVTDSTTRWKEVGNVTFFGSDYDSDGTSVHIILTPYGDDDPDYTVYVRQSNG